MSHVIIEVVGPISTLCVVVESSLLLLPVQIKYLTFMNNHVRQHSYLPLPLALTLSVLCLFGKEMYEWVN